MRRRNQNTFILEESLPEIIRDNAELKTLLDILDAELSSSF